MDATEAFHIFSNSVRSTPRVFLIGVVALWAM
jgi:hypothetical protein